MAFTLHLIPILSLVNNNPSRKDHFISLGVCTNLILTKIGENFMSWCQKQKRTKPCLCIKHMCGSIEGLDMYMFVKFCVVKQEKIIMKERGNMFTSFVWL